MHSTVRLRLMLSLAKIAAGSTLLAIVGSAVMPLRPVNAQELPPMPIQFNPDTLRSPGRPGGRRRGGGSRGGCVADGVPLSAIAYAESQSTRELEVDVIVESVGSFTTQAQPLLWFYLPNTTSDDVSAELVIKGEQDELLYRGQLEKGTEDNGIIRVPMPIEMAAGSAYHWFLSLDCGDAAAESVDGWIVRQDAQSEAAVLLAQAAPRNRVALYTNYGYVQDALSELAMMRLADLDDPEIAENWVGFLGQLGLEDLTAAPILDCCELAESDADTPELEAVEADVPSDSEEKAPERSVIEQVRDRRRSPRDR